MLHVLTSLCLGLDTGLHFNAVAPWHWSPRQPNHCFETASIPLLCRAHIRPHRPHLENTATGAENQFRGISFKSQKVANAPPTVKLVLADDYQV